MFPYRCFTHTHTPTELSNSVLFFKWFSAARKTFNVITGESLLNVNLNRFSHEEKA